MRKRNVYIPLVYCVLKTSKNISNIIKRGIMKNISENFQNLKFKTIERSNKIY